MNSLKQKELNQALLALNVALAKKASCSREEISLLRSVIEDVERRLNRDAIDRLNFLESTVHNQEEEITELKQTIKSFDRLFKKHAQRLEKEQAKALAEMRQEQKVRFDRQDQAVEQKLNEFDAKMVTDITWVTEQVEQGNDFATRTFKNLMVEAANSNHKDHAYKTYFAGGIAAGSIMALCLSVWLSLGAVQNNKAPQSRNVATLFDAPKTEVSMSISETGKTGLGAFDQKTAFNLIKNGMEDSVRFEKMPVIPAESVENNFPMQPKMEFDLAAYKSSFDMNNRDFIDTLKVEAENGNPWAQHDLALAYYSGTHIDKDEAAATKWFKESAMKGIPNAQYNLAVIYHKNVKDYKDLDRSIFWYEQAAAQNHPQALYNLAVAYGDGLGVEIDHGKAMAFFKRAYDKGIKEAAYYVAAMEEVGILNEDRPDYIQAQIWYERAAEAGSIQAIAALDRMVAENKIASSISGNSVKALNAIETAGE